MRAKKGLYDPANEHDACGVGFVVNINGSKTHKIVKDGVTILCNLEHRGAVGGDMKTGDGAGMLLQLPHRFFAGVVDFALPQPGQYGVGFFFLPQDHDGAVGARDMVEATCAREQVRVHGWREVPVNPDCLGEQARREMPSFWQVSIGSVYS